VELLGKEVARLKTRVDRAAENALLIDADNFTAAQDALNKIRREHERAANALKLAQCNADEDERQAWINAWKRTRERVVALTKDWGPPWESDKRDEQGNLYTCRIESHIDVEYEAFRALMRRLSVQIRFNWRRNGKLWTLTTGELRAQFDPNRLTEKQIYRENSADDKEGKLSTEWNQRSFLHCGRRSLWNWRGIERHLPAMDRLQRPSRRVRGPVSLRRIRGPCEKTHRSGANSRSMALNSSDPWVECSQSPQNQGNVIKESSPSSSDGVPLSLMAFFAGGLKAVCLPSAAIASDHCPDY